MHTLKIRDVVAHIKMQEAMASSTEREDCAVFQHKVYGSIQSQVNDRIGSFRCMLAAASVGGTYLTTYTICQLIPTGVSVKMNSWQYFMMGMTTINYFGNITCPLEA
jgi:hypothetical protein